ncbi:amidohydrolase family protein [bacterium]|nr:amidohydrolase family protein [bacterium]
MIFYDAHLHCRGNEAGGFFVGLEGVPVVAGTLDNRQVLALHRPEERYLGFHYVAAGELQEKFSHRLLKYHPRREKYSPAEVEASIRLNRPAAVMLDTLNEPYWQPGDYWRIARAFPEILFIFAHSGGYLIQDFIKICHFQPNIYIDFALTHTMLACYGRRPEGLPYIDEAIVYSLHAPFRRRVLLSSDAPFFDQAGVVEYYRNLDALDLLNENFITSYTQVMEKLQECH